MSVGGPVPYTNTFIEQVSRQPLWIPAKSKCRNDTFELWSVYLEVCLEQCASGRF